MTNLSPFREAVILRPSKKLQVPLIHIANNKSTPLSIIQKLQFSKMGLRQSQSSKVSGFLKKKKKKLLTFLPLVHQDDYSSKTQALQMAIPLKIQFLSDFTGLHQFLQSLDFLLALAEFISLCFTNILLILSQQVLPVKTTFHAKWILSQ